MRTVASYFLTALALTLAASNAQSSVTLYDLMDAGIEYETNVLATSQSERKAGASGHNANEIGLTQTQALVGAGQFCANIGVYQFF